MPQPSGPIWIHCPDLARLPAAVALAERLREEDAKRRFLVTLPQESAARSDQALTFAVLPVDKAFAVKAFLDKHRPCLLVWMEGHLRPLLLQKLRERAVPAILIDATAEHLPQPPSRWLTLRGQSTALSAFQHGLAIDGASAQRLTRLGLTQVEITGRLDPLPRVWRCHDAERAELTESIAARPVWLACNIPMTELSEVILAHRTALRGAHRLLLILQPSEDADPIEVRRRLDAAGFHVAERAEDDVIDDSIDVLLADSAFELGLWYRLASITFMGGTLKQGGQGRNPLEPTALGSALLAGPQLAPFGSTYLKLERAGGTKLVRSGQDLARMIDQLLSPELAAQMALAAWDIVTTGAESTNRVVALVETLLQESSL